METHPVDSSTNRPDPEIRIKDITIFVDPFEEFLKQKRNEETQDLATDAAENDETDRRVDDDRMTWTGKRVRDTDLDSSSRGPVGVGKYLQAALAERGGEEDEIVELVDGEAEPEPASKKIKGSGGFGDFSSW